LLFLLAASKVALHCLGSRVLGIELQIVDFTFVRKIKFPQPSAARFIEQLCDANVKDSMFSLSFSLLDILRFCEDSYSQRGRFGLPRFQEKSVLRKGKQKGRSFVHLRAEIKSEDVQGVPRETRAQSFLRLLAIANTGAA